VTSLKIYALIVAILCIATVGIVVGTSQSSQVAIGSIALD